MKKTPLNQTHINLGAKMVDFGGWHMPVQYSGLSQEHHAVRTKAGLFDVSHMGEVTVEGTGAEDFLNLLVTNNVSKLVNAQALYTVMCREDGGVIDDLLVYKRIPNKYFLCINAGNIEKDYAWMEKQAASAKNVSVKNVSEDYCQVALQGPLSEKILAKITNYPLANIKYYTMAETNLLGFDVILSRTGYTGEDGFEIYAPANAATKLWNTLMDAGKNDGLIPCGLGCRDTLRTEMKFPLYGHELSFDINPLEAGLGWMVKLDKPNFIGKDALARVKQAGIMRNLVGIKALDKGIPRQGYEVYNENQSERLGEVTSGTMSPTLGYPIAIAFVKNGQHAIGNKVSIKIRDKFYPGEIVATPFYKKN